MTSLTTTLTSTLDYTTVLCDLSNLNLKTNELLYLSAAIYHSKLTADEGGYITFGQSEAETALNFSPSQTKHTKSKLIERGYISSDCRQPDCTIPIRVELEKITEDLSILARLPAEINTHRQLAQWFWDSCETKSIYYPSFVKGGLSPQSALLLNTLIYLCVLICTRI
jgi:hypothetical protein